MVNNIKKYYISLFFSDWPRPGLVFGENSWENGVAVWPPPTRLATQKCDRHAVHMPAKNVWRWPPRTFYATKSKREQLGFSSEACPGCARTVKKVMQTCSLFITVTSTIEALYAAVERCWMVSRSQGILQSSWWCTKNHHISRATDTPSDGSWNMVSPTDD